MKVIGLPLVVQQQVFVHLNNQEIVLLSFCSAKMKKKVKEMRLTLSVLELEYTTKRKAIRLRDTKRNENDFELCIDPTGLSREHRRSPKRFSVKNGSDTHYCRIYEDKSGFLSCKINLENASRMVEYLKGLFRIAPLKLNIDPEIIPNLKRLLSDPVYQQLDTFQLSGLHITWTKLSSIFNAIPIQNRVVVTTERIHGEVDKRCKVFEAKTVFFRDAHWLTREHFLSFDSIEKAIFMNVELTTDDLIAFVKHWRDSGNTKLVAFAFFTDRVSRVVRWNLNAIVTEMGAQPWNRAQRGRYAKFDRELLCHREEAEGRIANWDQTEFFDISVGFDFERSDGLLASIDGNTYSFVFNVWYDRFPQYPGNWSE